jgi:hypothetical protein
MLDIILGQLPTLAVFQPLLAHLIAADVEVPDGLRNALEADGAGFRGLTFLCRGGIDSDCADYLSS